MKGQISYIEPIFALLITGILAVVMAVMLPGQVTNVMPAIETSEFENRALILANSLLENQDLTYSDGVSRYRGIFDAEKLNNILFKKGSFTELYRCQPSEINCQIPTYPLSYALIMITDMENSSGWFTGTNRLAGSGERGTNIQKCFSKTEMGTDGLGKMFNSDANLVTLLELDSCNLVRYSNIMNSGFPISIRYSDTEVHMGLMKVMVVE